MSESYQKENDVFKRHEIVDELKTKIDDTDKEPIGRGGISMKIANRKERISK